MRLTPHLLGALVAVACAAPADGANLEKKLKSMLEKASKKAAIQIDKAAAHADKVELLQAALDATDDAGAAAKLAKAIAKWEKKQVKAEQKAAKQQHKTAVLADELALHAEPFQFASLVDVDMTLVVRDAAGAPMPHVRVVVTEPLSSPDAPDGPTGGRTFLSALTGADGAVDAVVRVPSAVAEVVCVVHRPGFVGPYTDESERALAGPFATSARLEVTRGALVDLSITLVPEAQ